MNTKASRIARFYANLAALGFTESEAYQLRRCEMALHRWAERECNGEIERDETTGKCFRVWDHPQASKPIRYATADRETGALKRARAIVDARNAREWVKSGGFTIGTPEWVEHRVRLYHQTDPRGCALYLVRESDLDGKPIESVYNRGVAVCY